MKQLRCDRCDKPIERAIQTILLADGPTTVELRVASHNGTPDPDICYTCAVTAAYRGHEVEETP
jgi:hypothetical protein